MPAPTFILTQTIPTCTDTGGTAATESNGLSYNLARVLVDNNCCRKYGTQVRLMGLQGAFGSGFAGVKTLDYEGTLSTCSDTAAGTKVYSSDVFVLCRGGAFTGTHSGSGTVSGASFSGSGTGTATGSLVGPYSLSLSGTFTSPGNGTFSGTISGAISGTFSGTITGGVVTSVTYTLATGGTASGSGSFTVDGGGTTFTFSGTITGSSGPPVDAYLKVTWSGCSVGQVVAQVLLDSDDSVVMEYVNERYAVKGGRITILNRKEVVDCSDNPCPGVAGNGNAEKLFIVNRPLVICFVPNLGMTSCLGTIRDKEYTLTFDGTHALFSPFSGTSNTGTHALIAVSASTGTPPGDFSLTGTLQWSGGGFGEGSTTATVDFDTITGLSGGMSASVSPCNVATVGAANVSWSDFPGTSSCNVTITGGTFPPGFPTAFAAVLDSAAWAVSVSVAGNPSHDYCGGDLVLTPSSSIVAVFVGSGISFTITSAGHSVTLTISQSGDAYP